ncbi:MAG: hypothetical protein A2007_02465 [Verrucomicrobia bacterium GWC2_42_7]|nr:MAG: hypothetical protein A2007_02465 [Verrucomicrobia bacterium GWC2_42_7]
MKTVSAACTQETLIGTLEKIIYSNRENSYTVGEFRADPDGTLVKIAGLLPNAQCGETLKLFGTWITHSKFGRQFKVDKFESKLPATLHGIKKYLASGLVPGIGKAYATKIVEHFKEDTLRVISEESARLAEVEGIGKGRIKAIKEAWDEQHALREMMVFLQTYNITTGQCLRLYKAYGNNARAVIQQDPYRVAREIHGIGFKTADAIALNLGFANDCHQRVSAGILYALGELESDGHTCYPKEELEKFAAELLHVSTDKVADRMRYLIQDERLVFLKENDLVQLLTSKQSEEAIALNVRRLMDGKSSLKAINAEKLIQSTEQHIGFKLAPEQISAIHTALNSKISIITGGPGTGKTTILKIVVDALIYEGAKILLAAPTGRAAQRMKESTNAHAQTIHRLLKFDPFRGDFTVDEDNPLTADFIIIDEASMLDIHLAASLLKAVPINAHVLLVGDIHQLPSVGPGNVLKDLINSNLFNVTQLQKIFRQGERSEIVVAAYEVLQGFTTLPQTVSSFNKIDPNKDFHFIQAESPEACVQAVVTLCESWLPKWYQRHSLMDVQILAPMHKGTAGIGNLNLQLQQALNKNVVVKIVGEAPFKFVVGDKVIQTRNNYDKGIFNGDLGRIMSLDRENGKLCAEFNNEMVEFERVDAQDLAPAYAISVHKSQGSEFPIVVLPLVRQHFMLLQRNLLYTAITRGRKKVFIVGDPSAYAMAVRNKESTLRKTTLPHRLKSAFPQAPSEKEGVDRE